MKRKAESNPVEGDVGSTKKKLKKQRQPGGVGATVEDIGAQVLAAAEALGGLDNQTVAKDGSTAETKGSKKAKSRKEKKRKDGGDAGELEREGEPEPEPELDVTEPEPKTNKKAAKDRKDKSKKIDKSIQTDKKEKNDKSIQADKKDKKDKSDKKTKKQSQTTDAAATEPEATETGTDGKKHRFIVFVGNLPYTATSATVTAHFSALRPSSVRLLTDKNDSTRCRGVAFVEFANFDRMKTCLDKYHHSEFSDGVSPARKINIELTCVSLGSPLFFVSSCRLPRSHMTPSLTSPPPWNAVLSPINGRTLG